MLDQHDRQIGSAQSLNMGLQFVGFTMIETGGRLIEKNRAWAPRHGTGQLNELLLAVGEAARLPVRQVSDAKPLKYSPATLVDFCVIPSSEPECLGDESRQ